jgi:hypothetical protein
MMNEGKRVFQDRSRRRAIKHAELVYWPALASWCDSCTEVIWLLSKILISVNRRLARRAVPARQNDDASSGLLADGHAAEGGDTDWA